jgi:starch synthase
MKLNIAILGNGEKKYSKQIKSISSKHKNINFYFGYDEELSRRMYASADFMLMPSLFEPCGLNQLIAMNYGTIPIVNSVGGLKDSVNSIDDFDSKNMSGFGICFEKKKPKALIKAIKKALELYKDKERLNKINLHNMECDFSWDRGAKAYATIYNSLVEKR